MTCFDDNSFRNPTAPKGSGGPPTEPGWYWARMDGVGEWSPVEVQHSAGTKPSAWMRERSHMTDASRHEWGPRITTPDESGPARSTSEGDEPWQNAERHHRALDEQAAAMPDCPKCGHPSRRAERVPGYACKACGCVFRPREPAPPTDGPTEFLSDVGRDLQPMPIAAFSWGELYAEYAATRRALAESRAEVERLHHAADLLHTRCANMQEEKAALRDRVRVLEAGVRRALDIYNDPNNSGPVMVNRMADALRRALATTQEPPAKEEP